MHVIRSLGMCIPEFIKDECFYLAATLSYFSIMSLVPLSLLIVSLFGYLIGENQDLYRFILSGLVSLFPAVTDGITAELKNIIAYKGISLLMLLIYGFLSFSFFYSIEHAMNIIFKVSKKRNFFLSVFWSIIIMTLVIVFLLLSFTLSSVSGIFKVHPLNIFGVGIGYKAGIFLKYIAPIILVLMSFTAVYIIIPRVKVRWRNALTGALCVTVMWEFAKYVFTWYFMHTVNLGAIYGSLTTFIIFLLWVYYSSCIFLFGAEFVSNLENRY